MTILEAAKELNRTRRTLMRWIASGKIEATKIDCGRLLDISQKEIDRIKQPIKVEAKND